MSQSDHEENRSLKRILSKLPDLLREELDEITRAKVDNISDNTLGLLAVMPLEAMAVSDFPLHELLALSEDRRIIDIGEKIIFLAMLKLANGIETSWQQRYLVSEWARQRLAGRPRWSEPKRVGRPNSFVKAAVVRAAYLQKIQRKPNDKRDAIIKELEQEFGLESRRIRAMTKEVGRLLP